MSDHSDPVASITSRFIGRLTSVLRVLASRYPRLNELFARWLCIVDCAGEIYEVTGTVLGYLAPPKKIRGRDEYAMATTVHNLGANTIAIKEDGNTVMLVEGGESKLLLTQGYGEITATTVEQATQDFGDITAVVNTHQFTLTQPNAYPFPEVGMNILINGVVNIITVVGAVGEGLETHTVEITVATPGTATLNAEVTLAHEETEIKVTTLRRCKCDVTAYVDDERPIGDDLI
jgi:hypothetical protein